MNGVDEHIFCDGLVWYFWNETQDQKIGPFSTREEARAALIEYADNLDD